jgi:hypothetical protein
MLSRWQPPGGPVGLSITCLNYKTGKEGNVFNPADEMLVRIRNNGDRPAYFELDFVRGDGMALIAQPVTVLESGQTFTYPKDRAGRNKEFLSINDTLGSDFYVLFASFEKFSGGVVLHNSNQRGTDRVIHRWHDRRAAKGALPDLKHLITKTISVLTVEKETLEVKTRPKPKK